MTFSASDRRHVVADCAEVTHHRAPSMAGIGLPIFPADSWRGCASRPDRIASEAFPPCVASRRQRSPPVQQHKCGCHVTGAPLTRRSLSDVTYCHKSREEPSATSAQCSPEVTHDADWRCRNSDNDVATMSAVQCTAPHGGDIFNLADDFTSLTLAIDERATRQRDPENDQNDVCMTSQILSAGQEVNMAHRDPDSLEVIPSDNTDISFSFPEPEDEPETEDSETQFGVRFPRMTEPVLYSEYELYPTVVYAANADGDNLLHLAVIHGKVDAVHRILHLTPEARWLDRTNLLLQSPLHVAVLTRQPRVVRMLVVRGASVELVDRHGDTPLHMACRLGDLDSVIALTRPVHYTEVGQCLYRLPIRNIPQDGGILNYAGESCLHLAAAGRHHAVARYLVSDRVGFDVNQRDSRSGRTILHKAVEALDINLLESLILARQETRLDLNAATYSGLTALRMAEMGGHLHLARSLEAFGAERGIFVGDEGEYGSQATDRTFT